MSETFQLYVKATSNCEGLPLQTFERLGPEWTGDSVTIPFGEPDEARPLEVVGWTDLFTGQSCAVHVARVRWLPHERPDISGGPTEAMTGYLLWGGNSGVRVLDDDAWVTPGIDDHLPPGHGRPLVWIEDPADLPPEVRAVVDGFTIGELAQRVAGGNLVAMVKMLNDAGADPRVDENQVDPTATVPRLLVIDLAVMRAGDREGRLLAQVLGETMT